MHSKFFASRVFVSINAVEVSVPSPRIFPTASVRDVWDHLTGVPHGSYKVVTGDLRYT